MPHQWKDTPAVLVVADEPLLLRLYARILESAGFVAWRMGDCRAALEHLARPDARPQFVVTDLGASEQGSRELGHYLADRLPAVPVLRVVGRPDQSGRLGTDDPLGYFLPKPFTAAQFLRAVEMVCGGQPEPRERTTRQGLPTARTFAGTSRTTTLPAPTAFSPMVTPGQTIVPPPSQTPSPIEIGNADSNPDFLVAASSGCVAV